MKQLSFVIRLILTIALLLCVYHETGIYTAVSLTLIFITVELLCLWLKKINEILANIVGIKNGKL